MAVMAQEVPDQQDRTPSWLMVPAPGVGTVTLDQTSAVPAPTVIAPDRMAGAEGVAPVITQVVAVGQATWYSAVSAPLLAAGMVSLAKVALAVVAPYMMRGPDAPAPILPVPSTMHLAEVGGGQTSRLRAVTVVPAGKESAVHDRAAVPRPVAALPEMTMGPLGLTPILPVPMAMQLVSDGQASEDRAERVTPVVVPVAQVPPNPPDRTIGVPGLGTLLVPRAAQPVPVGEHTRLVNPVTLAGMVTAVHASTPVPEIVSDSTAAPVAVVPMATQLTADGHTIWESDVTPVRAVPVLAAATDGPDGLASMMTGVLTPPVSWYPTPSHSTVPAQAIEAMRVAATGTLTVDQLA